MNDTTKSTYEYIPLPDGSDETVWRDVETIDMKRAKHDLSALRYVVKRWESAARAATSSHGVCSELVVRLRGEIRANEAEIKRLREVVAELRGDLVSSAASRERNAARLESELKTSERAYKELAASFETMRDDVLEAIESLALGGR